KNSTAAGGSLRWDCFPSSDGARCSCRGSPASSATLAPGSMACDLWNCCLQEEITPQFPGDAVASCDCFDATGSCDAERAARPGSRVVPTCPNLEGQARTYCAPAGVSCDRTYLQMHEYSNGCCDGLVCDRNSDGVPTCRATLDWEVPLLRECRKAA